ncbi:Smr/MutS family protein [Mesomycoplasma molare]|uniref:Smr/MutS family protein n=1 Tax=Mesomycoplasma molare TaxID=171288 RepID=UPI000684B99B|nr:Smr/MutS family protein [Mesomycoplasma molare]
MNYNFLDTLIIDLHGYTTSEAETILLHSFFEFHTNDNYEEMEIIVGKGTGTLKVFVRDLIEKENLFFSETEASFIIWK